MGRCVAIQRDGLSYQLCKLVMVQCVNESVHLVFWEMEITRDLG